MKLPYRKQSYIPMNKLINYLLSETHAVGKLKAKFFRAFGFNETNVTMLKQALLKIAYDNDVKEVASSIHGKKYVIEGSVDTPNGKVIKIQTVWLIEKEGKHPRLITAYPV